MIETINVTGLKQEQIKQLQQMITNFKTKNEEEINYNAWGNPVTRESSQTVINQIKQLRKTINLDQKSIQELS